MSLEGRRLAIVEAALELLAEMPVEALSTRRIARRVGVSQPALFRHFRSREQILLAVVEHSREQLAGVATSVLEAPIAPAERLRRLARGLLTHVEGHPGLPRLLFAGVGPDGPVDRAVRQLLSSQVALVTELVREGQRRQGWSTEVAPEDAATLFVGMVQGVVLQWEVGGRQPPLGERADTLFRMFRDGLHGGGDEATSPAASDAPYEPEAAADGGPTRSAGLQTLDVRPILERGDDPLESILAAVDAVGPAGVVKLVAPFEPRPLLALLRGRGHAVRCEQLGRREFAVEIVVAPAPEVLDLRALEPPEPLERVLEAVERLGPGEVLLARTPRAPRFLFPRLEERGLAYEVHEEPDATALLRVRRPA